MLKLPEVQTFPIESYKDHRGEINSLWKENRYTCRFLEDRISYSKCGVLRGFHCDGWNSKLFICLQGSIYLVVVDKNGIWDSTFLSSNRKVAVLVPPSMFNATLCLSSECIMFYKWSHEYLPPEQQYTLKYNDPTINVDWPITPILSERDQNGKSWQEIKQQLVEKGIWKYEIYS